MKNSVLLILCLLVSASLLLILPACLQEKTSKQSQDKTIIKGLKPEALYKIVPSKHYTPKNQDDAVKLMPLDIQSGFIHTSFGNQAQNILQKFFTRCQDIILLELGPQVLQQHGLEIRKEQNRPNGDFFPHIYGIQKIPADAILAVIRVIENPDGTWTVIE